MLKEKIHAALCRAYKETNTQEALAQKAGIDQGTISSLLNGKRSCSGIRVETLEKLFPELEIVFYKDEKLSESGLKPIEEQIVLLLRSLPERVQAQVLVALAAQYGKILENHSTIQMSNTVQQNHSCQHK